MTRVNESSSLFGYLGRQRDHMFTRLAMFGIAATGISSSVFLLGSGRSNPGLITALVTITTMTLVGDWSRMREKRSSLTPVILLLWFVTTPIASFYLKYPVARSLITYDRAVIFLLAILLVLSYTRGFKSGGGNPGPAAKPELETTRPLPVFATRFELWWLALTAFVLINALAFSTNIGAAIKTAVDAFALPLVVFHTARHFLGTNTHGKWLLLGAIILAFLLVSFGTYEIITGNDALAYKGAELVREGELRVNGPFASDSSYSVISALIFIFLLAAPRIFEIELDQGGRIVYWLSVVAAGISAMLPFFRVTAIAIATSWILLELAPKRGSVARQLLKLTARDRASRGGDNPNTDGPIISRRRLVTFTIGSSAVAVLVASSVIFLAPTPLRERLLSLRNAYGRLATWSVAARIAYEHPLLGAGLGNYEDQFHEIYSGRNLPIELSLDTHAASEPHSNLVSIATELGAAGLLLYLLANYYLLKLGYRGLVAADSGTSRAAAACFVALFVVYSIPGLMLTSGTYSDLNLYFFFLLGLLSTQFRVKSAGAEAISA